MVEQILSAELATLQNQQIALVLAQIPEGVDLARSDLARKIVQTDNDPWRWADICRLALEQDVPTERRIALLIEEANCRRPPLWEMSRAEASLASAIDPIESLAPGDRRDRLVELYRYHSALVLHALGKYREAAAVHEDSAQDSTDPFSAAIARYMATYERLNQQLVEDAGNTAPLEIASRELFEVLDIGSAEGLRWHINALCHLIRVRWLAFDQTPTREALGDITKMLPKELAATFSDALGVCYALNLQGHNADMALWIARRIGNDPRADVDWASEALLLAAEIETPNVARATLQSILALPSHGGHVAKAIAQRMLADLA